MTVNLSMLAGAAAQFLDNSGNVLTGGKIYTYAAGTTTNQTTYTSNTGLVAHTNPIILDASGRVPGGEIWLTDSVSYKFVLKDTNDVLIATYDNITGNSSGIVADLANTTDPTKGDALVGFRQSNSSGNLTGAIGRTVHQKFQESVSVLDFGADPTGVADSTTAFQNALNASLSVYAPAGTYIISAINLNQNGHTLLTDGFATIFQQKSGTGVTVRMINVQANNIIIESCRTKGNIATDTSEFKHSIFIQSDATNGNLTNITVGDIYGEDVRGDVLYIGAATGYLTTYVRFGRITGSNILRNVVSIVGGAYVTGDAAISSGPTGLWALDIEPDTVTCHDIHVELVRGTAMGCVPPLAANAAYNISIGMADLDPSFAPDSTPAYVGRNVISALTLRNIKSFQIDYLKAKDHTHFAMEYVYNAGEQRGEGIEIGYLNANNVGSGDVVYNTNILASGVNNITIHDGIVTLNDVANDSVIYGDSSGLTFTRAIINKMTVNGRLARYIKQGQFSNILINNALAGNAIFNCDDCTILDSNITIPTLISFSNRNTFINVTATCSTAYYGSTVADTTRINCVFGGVTTGFATQIATATALTGEIVYGSTTSTTVGAAGAASALPATPTGYITVNIAGTDRKIPFYAS
jgi:hypothetical protein